MTHLKVWVGALVFLVCSFSFSNSLAQVRTNPTFGDDSWVEVPLQFAFPFYGRVFSTSFMHSNGVVGFMDPRTGGPGAWAYCCEGIEASRLSPQFSYMIAPLWTDLYPVGSSRFSTEGTPEYQKYRWENIAEISNMSNLNTFGVEIRPSGFVGMNYEQINIQNQNTFIGITGDVGLGEYTQSYWGRGVPNNIVSLEPSTNPAPDPCLTNPLANTSCAGYAQAYHDQQCGINPLYATTCPGYEQAYFSQQCSSNPLYNEQCPGYASAFYDQQCILNPLYDSGCTGYEQAYFSLQCSIDALYDKQCPGYTEAYALKNVIKEPEPETVVEVQQEAVAGEPVSENPVAITSTVTETKAAVAVEGVPNPAVSSAPVAAAPQPESKSEQKVAQAKQPQTVAARAVIAARAKAAAESRSKEMSNSLESAKSMEEQTAQQEVVLGAISFVAGFDAYQNSMIPDSPFYKPEQLYKNNRTVDNARAQRQLNAASDLVHKKMIDDQYNR